MGNIVHTRIISEFIVYARAFFLKNLEANQLIAGETQNFPYKYMVGSNSPATAFEIWWYANQANADAKLNRLINADRLPSARFVPGTPNTADVNADELQDGIVALTAPASNGYENPVGVIEMVQDTGDFIEPYIYLLNDTLTISTDAFKDETFKYWIGTPAITAFHLEWYANRLDEKLMVRRLTDMDRLPRAVFTPAIPNTDAEPTELQEGTLRLYRPVSATPYTSFVGALCIEQNLNQQITTRTQEIVTTTPNLRAQVFSNWHRR